MKGGKSEMSYNIDDNNNDNGMKQAKHKTKMMGRPRISQQTRDLVIRLYKEDEMTCQDIATACNISIASLYSIVREWRNNAEEETN